MIARIKKENATVYDTAVFAIFQDGWNTKIIGFDQSLQTLEYIRFYDRLTPIHQQIVIIDASEDGWITKDHAKGYGWIVQNTTLLRLIEQDRYLPEQILSRCLEIQNTIHIPDWFEVKDQKSANNLLSACGDFHDAVIESVTSENGKTFITMRIWDTRTHLCLYDAILSDAARVGYGALGDIDGANIFVEDGRIYWTDLENVTSKTEISNSFCYFSASKLLWNIEMNG